MNLNTFNYFHFIQIIEIVLPNQQINFFIIFDDINAQN